MRQLHAERALNIADVKWTTPEGQEYHLIDNPDVALKFGETIGAIAASHWWNHDKVVEKLNDVRPAPPPYPEEWRIDSLKLAFTLRLSDAAHLDERRAPGFLWALRQPNHFSSQHWAFQNKLAQPDVRGDALFFRTTQSFKSHEAEAWWLAYDAIQMIDRELVTCDSLLADLRGEAARFTARRVLNVESPSRLVRSLEAKDWVPVDTKIKVSDLPGLVSKLGGEALYGERSYVPLRELVQNAIDAIRLRTATISKKTSFRGEVEVEIIQSEERGWQLEIRSRKDTMESVYYLGFPSLFG